MKNVWILISVCCTLIFLEAVRAGDQPPPEQLPPTDNGDDFVNMIGNGDDQNRRSRVERESAWFLKIKADLMNNTIDPKAFLTEIKTKFAQKIRSAPTNLTANNSEINRKPVVSVTSEIGRRQKRGASGEKKNNNGTSSEGPKDRGKGKGKGKGRGWFKPGQRESDGGKERDDFGGMQHRSSGNNNETQRFSFQLRHHVLENGTTPASEPSTQETPQRAKREVSNEKAN